MKITSSLDPSADSAGPLQAMRLDRMVAGALRWAVCFIAMALPSAVPSAAEEVLYEQKLEPHPLPILVPATIGGKTYVFELDTGAGLDFVDPTLKPFLGAYKENRKVDSLGHTMEVQIFEAPAITIGGWSLPPAIAGVSDMNRFRSISGVDIRGYIGVTALKDCSLLLNFDRRRMKIFKGASKDSIGMERLDLSSAGGSPPFIKCVLEGKTMEFLIDTGANGYLGLRHETFVAMVENGMIETNGGRKITVETGAGRMIHSTGRFTRGELLGVNLTNTPVNDTNVTNTIGMGFLLNFNAVIDLNNSRFFYQRRKITSSSTGIRLKPFWRVLPP